MGNRNFVIPVVPFLQSNHSRSPEQKSDNSRQREQNSTTTTIELPKNNRGSGRNDDRYADRERSTTEKLYDYLEEIACHWDDNDYEEKWNEVEKQIEDIFEQDVSYHCCGHRRRTMKTLIVKLNEELYSPLHN
ncbi:unnamed protein product, partial [Didymodactylos carnosus]